MEVQPHGGELLGDVGGVGVHDLPQKEFGPDGHDFSFHSFSPFIGTQIFAENTGYLAFSALSAFIFVPFYFFRISARASSIPG
jgi:hypothetical protein